MGAGSPELVEVRLLGLPLGLQERASEYIDGLRREFQLLVEQGQAEPASVPARLVDLAAELDRRFQAFTAATRIELEEARRRGAEDVDLIMRVPPELGPAVVKFARLMSEADAYCAAGEYLLTLSTPPDVRAFTQWALHEMAGQVEGRPPISWPEYVTQTGFGG